MGVFDRAESRTDRRDHEIRQGDREQSSGVLTADAPSILWIDEETDSDDPIVRLLAAEGFRTDTAPSGAMGISMARARRYDAIVVELRLPDVFGLTVLSRLVASHPETPIVIVTGHYVEAELKTEAARRGAAAVLYKPLTGTADLISALRSAMRAYSERSSEQPQTSRIVAASQPMRAVVDWIDRVGPSRVAVVVTGETGTGKEMVARALHQAGDARNAPFVPVNCAAIPEALFESELFGYRKGAFTGAAADKKGLFEVADGGTLFLDEIGDLPQAFQARLLRCLDSGEVRPIGETSAKQVDVRIIAATNRDLRDDVSCGRFRRDLYYRLCGAHCEIPPLRERPEDIEALVTHLLPGIAARSGARSLVGIPAEAIAALRAHAWPGNVRELRHVLERAVLNASGALLTERDVIEALQEATTAKPSPSEVSSFEKSMPPEAERILAALAQHRWNRSAAARSLGISRSTLWRCIKRFGLQ